MNTSLPLKSKLAHDRILDWIRSGRFGPGERLPSERHLAQTLCMSHLTVRRGLAELEAKGLIRKKPNVGSFVHDTSASGTVAMVLPQYLLREHGTHPFTHLMFGGAHQALDQQHQTLIALAYQKGQLWTQAGQAAIRAGVRGVLLLADSSVAASQVRRLLDAGLQLVLLQDAPALAGLGLATVHHDQSMALAQALEGLVQRGHRDLAVCMYSTGHSLDWMRSTLAAMAPRLNLGDAADLILPIPNAENHVDFEALTQLFDRRPRPTAVVVQDEFVAAALFRMCYARQVRVPDNMSVVALLDNTPHAHPVPLAAPDSVRLVQQIGAVAANQLLQRFAGARGPKQCIVLRGGVQWKASVKDGGAPESAPHRTDAVPVES